MKIQKYKWLCAVILPIVLGILILLQPPVFYLNDDITMRSILSGAYTGTPDGHAVYMQYPLTGLLALAYKVAGIVPWLEIFFTVCLAVCMVLMAMEFENPVIGGLVALFFYMPFCFYMHYTLVAALVAATGVFLLVRGSRKWWTIVLILTAYMIRGQIGLLSLPFVACALVWQVISVPKSERKNKILGGFRIGGYLVGAILLCALIHNLCYSPQEWKDYQAYNGSRTLLYDYTDFLSTDAYAQNYASYGMTEEEYQVLSSYNTMLDERIDKEKMQQVAEAVSQGMAENQGFLQKLKNCVQKYYLQIRYSDVPYNYIWLAAYLLLAIGFVLAKKWMPLLVLCVLGAGRSAVWMYLIWKGRFPERVSLSLYLLELMLLLGMGMWLWKESKVRQVAGWKLFVTVGAMAGLLALGIWQGITTNEKIEKQLEVQEQWDVLQAFCEKSPETLYLADVFSVVEYGGVHYQKDAENIMLLGGWMSESPLAKKRLESLQAADGAQALAELENVQFLVREDKDISWLEVYLQNRFGECELTVVEEIEVAADKWFVIYEVTDKS